MAQARGPDTTVALTEEEIERSRQAAASRQQLELVVCTRDGALTIPLLPNEPVVVGREPPADLVIRDASLSRQHASVHLQDGVVWVEDLGSTNGTKLGGERLGRARLEPGDELTFGAVAAYLQPVGPSGASRPGSTRHEHFLAELAAEVARARAFGRGLALLLARIEPGRGSHAGRWLPDVEGRLRPFDRLALYGPGTVEILLPEAGEENARLLAERLCRDHEGLWCGIATLPLHAASAEELVAVALAALRRAGPKTPVEVAAPLAHRQTSSLDAVVVASAPAMVKALGLARKVAGATIPVLVVGETGSGKEVVAHALHDGSPRRDRPMICVNCGALPAQLVETTLFGHEKGAFTGAAQRSPGVFEAADGGTVFLDEVGELPAAAQAALLRVLETKHFTRVGSLADVEVDVRVVAATHRDLSSMVAAGSFRQDLLYRLNAMVIEVPPLRARHEDIEPLARRFAVEASAALGREVREIDGDALAALRGYFWPGNVRELRNAIERAVVICEGGAITLEDLPAALQAIGRASRLERPSPGEGAAPTNLRGELDRIERDMVKGALDRARGDRQEAARLLGLPLRTLADKIRKHGLG